MSLHTLLAEDTITVANPAVGKLIIAVIIIMALWGQKTDKGGK